MRSFFNSKYFFWALLAVPSVPMTLGLIEGTDLEGLAASQW